MPNETVTTTIEAAPLPPDELIAQGLDELEQNIQLAAQEIASAPEGTYTLWNRPDNYTDRPNDAALAALRSEEYNPALLSRYAGLFDRAKDLYAAFSEGNYPNDNPIGALVNVIKPERLHVAFQGEDPQGPLHNMALKSMSDPASNAAAIRDSANFLQGAYGLERPIDLMQKTTDPYASEVRRRLLTPEGIGSLRFGEVNSRHAGEENRDWEKEKHEVREWMRDVVLRATDIDDPDLADSYVYAASRALGSAYETDTSLLDVVQKMEALGPDKLATLREFAGIYSLYDYSMDQLERMVRVAEGDPEEIERLRQHDVLVLMSNKMGDYNNILHENPERVDDEGQRALFFEIQSAADIYRYAHKLSALGIAPSTLLFSMHGGEGQINIHSKQLADGSETRIDAASVGGKHFNKDWGEKTSKELNAQVTGISMHDMKGFARMVEKFMQPSRGIDDDPESNGRKKIAFISCSSGVEVTAKELDTESGELFELGEASIVSQLAHDIAKHGPKSDIDVYGIDAKMQIEKTANGFRYTVYDRTLHKRVEHSGVLMRIHNGEVRKSVVDEVPLRKAADEPKDLLVA